MANKKQYRAVIRAQKEAAKPPSKLIHLLINYRSHNFVRYPPKFIETAKQIKAGRLLFDYSALSYFISIEGDRWRQPKFDSRPLPMPSIRYEFDWDF
jgi:hypothetical protein